jgi:uncharacterized membrane protein
MVCLTVALGLYVYSSITSNKKKTRMKNSTFLNLYFSPLIVVTVSVVLFMGVWQGVAMNSLKYRACHALPF